MSIHKVFLSYSRVDGAAFALKLAVDLKKEGFDVWIDQKDIRAGSEWDIEIEKALESCDCVLFIETGKSVTSNNVLDEVYYALEQQKKVIPLILVDSKTPFRLMRLQHIDFTKNYATGLSSLLNELKDNISQPSLETLEKKGVVNAKPFYKKHAGLLLGLLTLIIVTVATFLFMQKKDKPSSDDLATSPTRSNDIVKKSQENQPGITIDTPAIKSANDTINVEKNNDKHTTTQSLNKQLTTGNKKSTNRIEPGTDRSTIIPEETFIGDWQLVNVEPKAESTKGYLKITASDDNRVVVKSYVQFYYPKNNQAAFPTVFNAFAGCSSCVLSKDIKLQAEDVAIGSQVYKILDQDEKGGKAGDTIAQTGSNKSIHATVTLQLINNTTALIKVQRPTAVSLSDELTLQPFVYVFKFSKAD